MHTISHDSPCYYLTSVAKDRLPVFANDRIKVITCAALDEARRSGKFALYAYVIMPDHLHVITDSVLSPSRTLQFINVHYTHQNPVRAGLVQRAEEYRWSSIRCWTGNVWDDEPLLMDISKINWRSGGGAATLYKTVRTTRAVGCEMK
jgi:REP element-mobilizing transposase RayT